MFVFSFPFENISFQFSILASNNISLHIRKKTVLFALKYKQLDVRTKENNHLTVAKAEVNGEKAREQEGNNSLECQCVSKASNYSVP